MTEGKRVLYSPRDWNYRRRADFAHAPITRHDLFALRRHRLGLRSPLRPAVGRPARLPLRWGRDALPEVQPVEPGRPTATAEGL